MRRFASLCVAFLAIVSLAQAQQAPSAFDKPVESKSLLDAQLHALPQRLVASYLTHLSQSLTYSIFAGQNAELAAKARLEDAKCVKVGENATIGLIPNDVLSDQFMAGGYHVFLGAITSRDAYDLRLKVDLSGLNKTDELYVVDPTLPRSFGPYTRSDALDGGRWLATVQGDTAVLVVRSLSAGLPQLQVLAMSHFFRNLDGAAKELSCNNLIACETNSKIEALASAVGRYVFSNGPSMYLCSGSLVNNPDTPQFEPYFLTANHCISTNQEALTVEVYWDYRVATCDSTASPPALNTLLRSNGKALLATDGVLDCTLLQLDNVQAGSYGRTYLGWSTQALSLSAEVIDIHHPQGSHMRISYGNLTLLDQSSGGFQHQNRVSWYDGVTEGGSSGSPLILNNGTYPVVGTLSNGSVHVCPEDPKVNYDYFSSFKDFYPEVKSYLSGTGGTPQGTCPANVTMKDYPQLLKSLRALRDSGLLKTPLGRKLVQEYYQAAPGMAQLVQQSDTAKGLFLLGAGPAAQIDSGGRQK